MGSYSVVRCIRCLMGQTLYCSAANAGMWRERGYGDGCTPYHDSAVLPCFCGYPAFLHRHLPPQSPPSHPLDSSLHSQQQRSPWDCSLTPAPSCCAFQRICVPVGGMYGCGKDCLILIPFRLPQISCFTLSLKCFSSNSVSAPMWGSDPCFSSPTH